MRNLLDIVEATAAREGAESVRTIHLKIGEMAGVNFDSLTFAFGVLSKGTRAEGGRLECEKVPIEAKCRNCGEIFRPEDLVFRCPACGGSDTEITAGREMEIDYMEVDGETGADAPVEGG